MTVLLGFSAIASFKMRSCLSASTLFNSTLTSSHYDYVCHVDPCLICAHQITIPGHAALWIHESKTRAGPCRRHRIHPWKAAEGCGRNVCRDIALAQNSSHSAPLGLQVQYAISTSEHSLVIALSMSSTTFRSFRGPYIIETKVNLSGLVICFTSGNGLPEYRQGLAVRAQFLD